MMAHYRMDGSNDCGIATKIHGTHEVLVTVHTCIK